MSSSENPAKLSESEKQSSSKKRNGTKKMPATKVKIEDNKKVNRKRKPSDSDSVQMLLEDILAEYIEQGNDVPEGHNVKYEKYQTEFHWKMERLPHHFLPKFNITKQANIKDVRSDLLLGVSLPHSVYVSSKYCNNIDICHKRTIALDSYIQRLKNMQKVYLFGLKKNKKARKDEKAGIYSGAIVEYARRKDTHPDKYFSGDYDFYYTNGNLCSQPETNRVLHVDGNDMDRLSLSTFHVEDSIPTLNPINNITLSEENPSNREIFEVQFSKFDDSFLVRRRMCISIHQYSNQKFHYIRKFNSKQVPFISFSQDKENASHLAISNLDHQVRLYELENKTALQTFKLLSDGETKPFTNWNILKSWSRSVYLYASNRKINVIDMRTPEREWRSNYCGYDTYNSCSNFCNLTVSNFENMFYVGSSHKLYLVDMRQLGPNIEDKNTTVSLWTHQMSCWPLMLVANRHDDCEYVTLQSPANSDLRICENIQFIPKTPEIDDSKDVLNSSMQLNYQYKSPCMPYMPPNLERVFHDARRMGKGIKPSTGMENRIKACNTGLSYVGDSSNPYILTATSYGDIFAMHLFDRDSKTDRHSAAEVIGRFEENIFHSVRKVPIQITQVCDLSAINKVFRCEALSDARLGEDELIAPRRRYMGRWQKSLQTLYSYKDALVNDLLSIWDIDDDGERGLDIKTLEKTEKTDPNTLVSGWLISAQNSSLDKTYISEDLNDINPDFQSTMRDSIAINSSLANNNSLLNNATVTSDNVKIELAEQTLTAANKHKSVKKKSRYTKGF